MRNDDWLLELEESGEYEQIIKDQKTHQDSYEEFCSDFEKMEKPSHDGYHLISFSPIISKKLETYQTVNTKEYIYAVGRGIQHFIQPPLQLLNDMHIITAFHQPSEGFCYDSASCSSILASQAVQTNPFLYQEARQRMSNRWQGVKDTALFLADTSVMMSNSHQEFLLPPGEAYWQAQERMNQRISYLHEFSKNATRLQWIEVLTPFFLPSTLSFGGFAFNKMLQRRRNIGVWREPPVFTNLLPEVSGPSHPSIQRLTPNAIQTSTKDLEIIWALEPNGQMHYGLRKHHSDWYCHSDLTGGRPVIAAGELQTWNGRLIEGYPNNKTEHYRASGPSSEKAAVFAFQRDGFNVQTVQPHVYFRNLDTLGSSDFNRKVLTITQFPTWGKKEYKTFERFVREALDRSPNISQATLLAHAQQHFGRHAPLFMKDGTINPQVLNILKENRVKASFAIPVAAMVEKREARENEIKKQTNHQPPNKNEPTIKMKHERHHPEKIFVERQKDRNASASVVDPKIERELLMNFLIEERYKEDSTIQGFYKEYQASSINEPARIRAFFTLQTKVDDYLHSEAFQSKQKTSAVISLADSSAHFFKGVSQLTQNKSLARFSTGLESGMHVVKEMRKVQGALSLASLKDATSMINAGATCLSFLGTLASAFSVITSLFGDDEDEALYALHNTIITMWSEMRESFNVTWEMIQSIKEQLNEMDQHNAKRFYTLLCVVDYYSRMTLSELNEMRTSLQGQLHYSHQCLTSYLEGLTDEDAIKAVSIIQKETDEEIIQNLKIHTTEFSHWLTKKAAIQGRSKRIDIRRDALSIETSVLLDLLKEISAPEFSEKPLGLFASLAGYIDPAIISAPSITQMINPQDWEVMLAHYIKVMRLGIPSISQAQETVQESYQQEIKAIKAVPELVMNFLSKAHDSHVLWKTLVRDYLDAWRSVQNNMTELLEERRQKFNEGHGISREQKVLQWEQSVDENIQRVAQDPELMKRLNPADLSKILNDAGINQKNSKEMLEIPGASAHFQSITHTSDFLIAGAFKLVSLSVNYSRTKPQIPYEGHLKNHLNWLLDRCSKETVTLKIKYENSFYPFSEINHYTINNGAEVEMLSDRRICWKHRSRLQDFKIGWYLPKSNFSVQHAYTNDGKETIKQSIETKFLQPQRKQAADEMLHRMDFQHFECARMKLLVFIQLFDPHFNFDVDAAQKNIKTILNQLKATGSAQPLQTLLSPSFGATLLQRDLGCPNPCDWQNHVIERIASQPLYVLPLWKRMAHAYASLEHLTQDMESSFAQKPMMDLNPLLEETVNKMAAQHQKWCDQLRVLQQFQQPIQSLVATQAIGLPRYVTLEGHTRALHLSLQELIKETTEFCAEEEIDYSAPAVPSFTTENRTPIAPSTQMIDCLERETQSLAPSLDLIHTMKLLKEVAQHFEMAPEMNKPAVVVVGETGVGKSTLVNAAGFGIQYREAIDELGEICAGPADVTREEPAKTGKSTQSETRFPNILLSSTQDFYFLDMGGLRDSRGKAEEVGIGACMAGLQHYLQSVKGIVIVCDENAISRRSRFAIRHTLEVVGGFIKNKPQSIADQVCLVVTRYSVSQHIIFERLQQWQREEYANVTEHSPVHEQAILRVLSILTQKPQSILLIDVTKEDAQKILIPKIQAMPVSAAREFTFLPTSIEINLIQKVLQTILDVRAQLMQSTLQHQRTLMLNIQQTLSQLPLPNTDEWNKLNTALQNTRPALDEINQYRVNAMLHLLTIQQTLNNDWACLMGAWLVSLKTNTTNIRFLGDISQIPTQLQAQYAELETEHDFFVSMEKLAGLLGIPEESPSVAKNPQAFFASNPSNSSAAHNSVSHAP